MKIQKMWVLSFIAMLLMFAGVAKASNVYGDPEGRFSLPLVGDWTSVKTDGSYGRFALTERAMELYVVTVELDDFEASVDAALGKIGVDTSALSLLLTRPDPRWSLYVYSLGDGRGVSLAARVLDGATVALIMTGALSITTSPPVQVFLTIDSFATLPLAEYLEYRPPPAPSTIQAIKDFDHIEFYSGGQKLVGRLVLPEGEGPFPALVHVGGGSGLTTRFQIDPSFLQAAGFAVFSYDKRGVGDSEGLFLEIASPTVETSEWRLPQLADDALAAVSFLKNLKEVNPDQIGLMGGSQNGWTIPLATSRSNIPAFAVIVSGPTVSVGEQVYYEGLTEGVTESPGLLVQMNEDEREQLSQKLAGFDTIRGFDPRKSLEGMSIPGLWIWGDHDSLVPVRESRAILKRIIAEYDKDFTILYYPDKGHKIRALDMGEMVDWIYAHMEE